MEDSAHYKRILKKNGVKAISATENITEGSQGVILEAMLDGITSQIAEGVSNGRKHHPLD